MIRSPGRPAPLRLDAVVLAGGAGSRFGGRKLLAPWRGGRLIDAALATAFATPARRVVVATGFDAEAIAEAARAFAAAQGQLDRLRLAHAADHAEGLAASLRAGIAALSEDAEAALIFLGDMPAISPETPTRLMEALAGHAAAAPVLNGVRGHPVLVSRALFPALGALSGDAGAGRLLTDLGARLARVEVDDPGVTFDVDLPADLAVEAPIRPPHTTGP